MTVPDDRLRVLFAIPHLARGGGAERVMLTLLQRIDRRRFAPQLMVLDARRNELAAELPADVPLIDLQVARVRHAWRPITRALAQAAPDVLLSGLGHLNLMLGIMRPFLPRRLAVIGRETAVVTAFNAEFSTAALRNLAYRWFYPNLDLVVCQSEDMRSDLVDALRFPADRARLVANPVDVDRVRRLAGEANPAARDALGDGTAGPGGGEAPLRLVAIGRLAPQKGFDLLLQAVARLPRGSCRVAIVGDGPARDALAAQIDTLGLQADVCLAGYQPNPYSFLPHADALVLSSRYEGLPNVVLEALACGRPVIAMPCPGGTREIAARAGGVTLAHGVTAEALADAIAAFRARRDQPPAIDVSAYRVEPIVARYESLIAEAAAAARGRGGVGAGRGAPASR